MIYPIEIGTHCFLKIGDKEFKLLFYKNRSVMAFLPDAYFKCKHCNLIIYSEIVPSISGVFDYQGCLLLDPGKYTCEEIIMKEALE